MFSFGHTEFDSKMLFVITKIDLPYSFPISDLAFWLSNRLGFGYCGFCSVVLCWKAIDWESALKTHLCWVVQQKKDRTIDNSDLRHHVFADQLFQFLWVYLLVLCWKAID